MILALRPPDTYPEDQTHGVAKGMTTSKGERLIKWLAAYAALQKVTKIFNVLLKGFEEL